MSVAVRPLIAGNWKMNGLAESLSEARSLAAALAEVPTVAEIALCPPATLIAQMAASLQGTAVMVGGQDCHAKVSGAYTGDVAAEMLTDAGATLVILGHSERRNYHAETDSNVAAKVEAALRAGLRPVICVGETLEAREAGRTLAVISAQITGSLPQSLAGVLFAVAYEPCWAIGTGLTPTVAEIEAAHHTIRGLLVAGWGTSGLAAPILYGGSVKPENASDILKVADVGGALVGGAALKAADFLAIIRAV